VRAFGLSTDLREECTKEISSKLAELERRHAKEIAELEAKIKSLSIVGWKLDRAKFRIVPCTADGRPGPSIPARVLFEEYHEQVNS
jgi:hypothetical protein